MKAQHICLFLLIAKLSSAQNFGYLGRKNFVDAKLVVHVPLAARIIQEFASVYPLKYGVVNSGIYVNYMHILRRNAFALEGGIDPITARSSSSDFSEELRLQYVSIMPKYAFSGRTQFLPIGVTHQVGLGYFSVTGRYDGQYSSGPTSGKYPRFNGLSILYELTMRTALSKKILLAYSMRFTLNEVFSPDFLLDFDSPYAQKQLNFVSGSIGLTYIL